jgi:hypothetical protein
MFLVAMIVSPTAAHPGILRGGTRHSGLSLFVLVPAMGLVFVAVAMVSVSAASHSVHEEKHRAQN